MKRNKSMVRRFQKSDTDKVMQIWLNGNEDAHPFIPKEYWRSNFSMVREQLLQAEIFVCETEGEIQGFIGIVGEYIAGIFVERAYRSCGIGKQLLEYVKRIYGILSLSVYQKMSVPLHFIPERAFQSYQKNLMKILKKQNTQ